MAAGDVVCNLTNPLARRCAVFDGVDDCVSVPQSTCPPVFVEGKQTVSLWFLAKKDISSDEQRIFSHTATTNNNRFYISIETDGRLRYNLGLSNILIKNQGDWDIGVWNHIVVVRDKTTGYGTSYLNGVFVSKNAVTIGSNDQDLIKFGQLGADEEFDGCISDVKIWNRELTASEVLQDYQGKFITNGLIHRWKLDFNYNDSVANVPTNNSGSRLAAIDDQVAEAVADARTTANDKYLITSIGNKIMTSVIEEAA